MCSGCKAWAPVVIAACALLTAHAIPIGATAAREPLRVCADPNNLPFTNDRKEGFENAIAEVLAKDLGRPTQYFWHPQRRGFFRNTIQAHNCDVVMSVPAAFDRVSATRPYYRSSYVFVTRRDRRLDIRSFDDPRLRDLRIAIPITGDDYENPPPAQALAVRQLVDHLRGFPVYGDYSRRNPQQPIIDAVASGDVDVAVVWGPIAGYFATREPVALRIEPVVAQPGRDRSFAFDMAVGVRKDDRTLHEALQAALVRHSAEIHAILQRFGVPLAPAAS